MMDQIGRFKVQLIFLGVTILALSLLAWTALPKSMPGNVSQEGPATNDGMPQNSVAGDIQRGQDLFMGKVHFANDGPPCMGCHSVGNNGLLGGGAMGPNLTNVSTKRSQSELQAILSNSQGTISPVMQPIYAEHPLTAEEQVDLLAFLNASVGQPETNREWWVIGISLGGFFVSIVLIELMYHRRLRGVRKPMVQGTHSTK